MKKLSIVCFAFVFAFLGFLPVQNSQAVPFSCSEGAANPELGQCYNALDIEGDPSGDFRDGAMWQSDFLPLWNGLMVNGGADGFSASQFAVANDAVGANNAGNVENVLEGADWFGGDLILVGQEDDIEEEDDPYSSDINANLYFFHFGGGYMAFLFDSVQSGISIQGPARGLSNLRAFNVSVVPLPAALPLYGAGIVILGLIGWRKKHKGS
ncbi:MAG: hypothetical protein JKY12_06150 [Sneathiella sp.]|nr:hypothetical protein [Sneathiella sp.]